MFDSSTKSRFIIYLNNICITKRICGHITVKTDEIDIDKYTVQIVVKSINSYHLPEFAINKNSKKTQTKNLRGMKSIQSM